MKLAAMETIDALYPQQDWLHIYINFPSKTLMEMQKQEFTAN
jgi:hypothetical protein